ncbi:MAG: hypothetical protein ACFFCH_04405 [Promethearchaeota archaeon]
MVTHPLDKNTLDKSSRACPIPQFHVRSEVIDQPFPRPRWISQNRILVFYLISFIAGLILVNIAFFLPPIVSITEIQTGTGTQTSISTFSIVSSVVIPLLISVGIGLTAAALVPIAYPNSFRHRLGGSILFGGLYATASYIDLIRLGQLYNTLAATHGLSHYDYMLIWTTSPWIFLSVVISIVAVFSGISISTILLTSYFGEYIFTSFKGPMHFDPETRRTAVWISGGNRGTVLTINHKGGYTRAFTHPSKWQAYERKD